MLGGRVKTLHPSIHAGILARRDRAEDMRALEEQGIAPIDLVVCNLYPFRAVANRRGVSETEVIENIDVGGPTMVRAAAKNHHAVAVVTDPERYGFVLDELRGGGGALSDGTRRDLAAEAFAHTAGYDAAISAWFTDTEPFPEQVVLDLVKAGDLTYGENPHQRAAYYVEPGARRHLLSMIEQLGGRALSFNNLGDLQAARAIAVAAFQVPACAIVKHGNPCGVAVGATLEEAYAQGAGRRPAVGLRRRDRRQPAGHRRSWRERLAEQFIEVLFAPGYDDARARGAAPEAGRCGSSRTASGARRAPASATSGACWAACWCRIATPIPTTGTRCRWSARRRPTSRSGATCCSPGGCASTCARTRS